MRLFGSTSVTEAEFIHEQNERLMDRLRAETEKADRYRLELERERGKTKALMIPTGFTWPDARVYQDETTPTWWPGLHQDSVRPRDGFDYPLDTKPPRSKWDRTQIVLNVIAVVVVVTYVTALIVAQVR